MGKFIKPFTDFGFKHIFGREMDKDILIEFLNDLLEGEHTIKDLRIMNNERLPETEQGRKVIFDIHCETDKGERIIIEMQNREQPHFKDRALYYLCLLYTSSLRMSIFNSVSTCGISSWRIKK